MDSAPQAELDSMITNSCNTQEPDNVSKCDLSVKRCPLCNSDVKQFFINFNEMLRMCENTNCDYPFGYEPLQFSKLDDELASDEEVPDFERKMSSETNGTMSAVGNTCSLEIDKLNKSAASSLSTAVSSSSKHTDFHKKSSKTFKGPGKPVKGMQKNIQAISKLTTELSKPVLIKNKDYLMKLQNLQQSTSKKLLKPNEKLNNHKDERPFGGGELKIDISTNATEMASITIEINNK